MALMTWSARFSIGIDSIDSQHKKLINMINSLHDAMSSGDGAEYLQQLLSDLVDYTVTHFAYEERLFKEHGYPEFQQHKKLHDTLIEQIKDIKSDVDTDSNELGLSIKVMEFLRNWLTQHIMQEDKAYSGFLIEKGVK